MNLRFELRPLPILWWTLWACFQAGIFVIYFTLSETASQPAETSSDSYIWLAALTPFLISTIIRWAVMPRVKSRLTAFILFVTGLALAESTCYLGLFIFPQHREELFWISVLGIFQFMPYFAHRY